MINLCWANMFISFWIGFLAALIYILIKMKTQIKTMRLNQDQLDRLAEVLNYLGLGRDDTATVKTALNHLENVLQAQLMLNLTDAVESAKDNNKQISKLRNSLKKLKRNTKYNDL